MSWPPRWKGWVKSEDFFFNKPQPPLSEWVSQTHIHLNPRSVLSCHPVIIDRVQSSYYWCVTNYSKIQRHKTAALFILFMILWVRSLGRAQTDNYHWWSLLRVLSDVSLGCRQLKAWLGWMSKAFHARGWFLMLAVGCDFSWSYCPEFPHMASPA